MKASVKKSAVKKLLPRKPADITGPTRRTLEQVLRNMEYSLGRYSCPDPEYAKLTEAVEAIEKEHQEKLLARKDYQEASAKQEAYRKAYEKEKEYRLKLLKRAREYYQINGVTPATIHRFNLLLQACERPIAVRI